MNNYEWLDQYLLGKPGVVKDFKAEWQWWRYMVGGKMFAATMHPSEKYAPEYAEKDLLSLKCEPMMAELLRKTYPEILPGFYTDKANWNSVCLDGEVPEELMREMCDNSYNLIFAKLTKKAQREILGEQ
ncbi:MAG: MmcQ/YjbR family DNA-binding protein [Angelakisella sp.]